MDAKEALEIRRRQLLERLSADCMEFQPGYHTVREEILRPDRLEAETAYFWDRWAPRLGPSATMLIVRMRQACRRAGAYDDRDASVTLAYGEIGRFCGMSASTIKRLLQEEDVRRFIRKEAQMRDSAIGRVDAPNRYVVMMTDPLLPEDEERVRIRLVDRLLTQELLGQTAQPSPSPSTEKPSVRADRTADVVTASPAASTRSSAATPVHGARSGRVQDGPVAPVQNDPVAGVQDGQAAGDQVDRASGGRIDPGPPRRRPSILAAKASLLTARACIEPGSSPRRAASESTQNVRTHESNNVINVNNVVHSHPGQALVDRNADTVSNTEEAAGTSLSRAEPASGLPYIPNEDVEGWALRMVELTGDEKSINFYRKAARVLLQHSAAGLLDHALGSVKEAMREGKARRPAALLTSTLLHLAEEHGIFITGRSRQEADHVRSLVRQSFGPPDVSAKAPADDASPAVRGAASARGQRVQR